MRDPKSSMPPVVITGPGDEYRREHVPGPFWTVENVCKFGVIFLSVIVLTAVISANISMLTGIGLGAVGMVIVRRVP